MAVVINEIEVLPESPARASTAAPAPAPPPLDAAELQRLLDELQEQALRLHAH